MLEDPTDLPRAPAATGAKSTNQGSSGGNSPAPETRPPSIPDHELLHRIGSGSYGEVWLARNVLGTMRAVKVVRRQSFEKKDAFDREFNGLQKFEPISRTHEGLVDILQVGRTKNCLYYLMELADCAQPSLGTDQSLSSQPVADGETASPTTETPVTDYRPRTLRSDLRHRGRLPVSVCIEIGLKLTSALAHLHQEGLVHRDVKPPNIIFVNGQPKLADIGLVAEATDAHSMVGTVGYIPPEGPGTPQADLYSLGKVLYEAVTGMDRQKFPELTAALGGAIENEGFFEFNTVVVKACESDVRKRYQSASEMRADLLLLQSGKSVKRLRVLEKRLVRARRFGLALALVTVLASGAYYQARRTTTLAHARNAQSLVEAGTQLMMQGDLFGSLSYYVEALRIDPQNPAREKAHRIRVSSILSQLPKPVAIFTGQEKPIRQARFSPDGSRCLTHDRWRTVRVWDVKTEKVLYELPHASPVLDAAFSPDGRSILSLTLDQKAHVWDVEKEKYAPLPHFHDVGFRGYGLLFDAETMFLNRTSSPILTESLPFKHQFTNLTLSLGLRVQGESVEITGQVIDRTSGKALVKKSVKDIPGFEVSETYAGLTGFMVLSVWAHHKVSQRKESSAWFDNARATVGAGRPQLVDDFNDGELTDWWIAVTPNGRLEEPGGTLKVTRFVEEMYAETYAITIAAKTSKHFELREGQPIQLQVDVIGCDDPNARVDLWWGAMPRGKLTRLKGLLPKFVANGDFVLTQVKPTTLGVWNAKKGTYVAALPHDAKLRRVIAHPEKGTLLTLTEDGRLWRWDLSAGLEHPVPERIGGFEFVEEVNLDPTGTNLLLFLRDSVPQLWGLRGGHFVHRLDLTKGAESAVFDPQGNRLAVVDSHNLIWVWNIEEGSRLELPITSDVTVTGTGFSPDGKHLAIGTLDGLVRVLDVEAHTPFIPPIKNAHPDIPVKFSPDGSLLTIVHRDGAARIWDLTKVEARPFQLTPRLEIGPSHLVTTISQDGRLKARIVDELSVEVWEPEGEELRFRREFQQPVKTCYFTDDNQHLITEFLDGRAQIWELASGEPLTPLLSFTYAMGSAHSLTSILMEDHRPIEHLQRMVQMVTGTEFKTPGESNPLNYERVVKLWSQTKTDYAPEFTLSQEGVVRWHRDRARASEHDWDWAQAIFHMDRLLLMSPGDSSLLERREYAQKALGTVFPPRPPWSDERMLDLTEFYTDPLRSGSGFGRLPTKLTVGRTIFETRGFIRLAGNTEDEAAGGPLATRIPVNQKCLRFHFLHATEDVLAYASTAVRYLIHYTDGSRPETLEAKPGQDIYCWKQYKRYSHSSTNTAFAWVGWNASTPRSRLDTRTWENPHPEKVVESIELVSGMAGGSPLIFAITVE